MALAALTCSGEAGIDRDDDPGPVVAIAAQPAAVLSEHETAGPLFRVRGLVAEDDGGLWILDAGNHRLLRARRGEAPLVVGGKGAGPGEFRNPESVYPAPGGAVAVWDPGLQRLTTFSQGGELLGSRTVPVTLLPGLDVKDVLPLGGRPAAVLNRSLSALNPPDRENLTGLVAAVGENAAVQDTLATLPLSGPVVVREDGRGRRGITAFSTPFDTEPHADHALACGGVLAVSTGGRDWRIDFLGPDGRSLGRQERDAVGRPIGPEERDAYFATLGPEVRRRYDVERVIEVPERHAIVQGLFVSASGHLGVRVSPPGPVSEPAEWLVWPIEAVRGGRVVLGGEPTSVELARRFTPADIRADTAWGVHRDSLGVETVRAYHLAGLPRSACATR